MKTKNPYNLYQINLIIFLLFIFTGSLHSQTLSNYGIKAGLILSGTSTTDGNIVPTNNDFFVNYLNFDIGGFAELFNTKKFCISAEIHYELLGENNPNFTKVVNEEIANNEKIYKSKYLNDRFHYISFQVFPRYRFAISSSGENFYVFGGPSLNLLLSNSNSDDLSGTAQLKNYRLDVGGSIGFGANFIKFLILEFRFEHYFTGPYRFSYRDESASHLLNSFTFVTGIAFNKL